MEPRGADGSAGSEDEVKVAHRSGMVRVRPVAGAPTRVGKVAKPVNRKGVALLGGLALCLIVLLQLLQGSELPSPSQGHVIERREGPALPPSMIKNKDQVVPGQVFVDEESGPAAVERAPPAEVRGTAPQRPAQAQAQAQGGEDETESALAAARAAQTLPAFARALRRLRAARHGPPADVDAEPLVLTFASFDYQVTLVNWLVAARRAGLKLVGVVCLDRELRDFLEARGLACFSVSAGAAGAANAADTQAGEELEPLAARRKAAGGPPAHVVQLWTLRMRLLLELLEAGVSVVMSDTDAVWLRDGTAKGGPLSAQTGDIVLSRGKFPFDQAAQWGATACMGLAFFRATPLVVALVRRTAAETQAAGDDQVGVNRALRDAFGEDPLAVFGHKLSPTAAAHAVFSPPEGRTLPKVVLLAHATVPRFCADVAPAEWKADVVAAHCHHADGAVGANYANWGKANGRNAAMIKYRLWCPGSGKSPSGPAPFDAWLAAQAERCALATPAMDRLPPDLVPDAPQASQPDRKQLRRRGKVAG